MTTIPQPQTPIQHKPNTLFVGGISYKASEDDLKECFSKYGEVQEVKIIRDKFNFNQSKGYGFVTFADQPGADRAKQEGFVTLMGKTMNVGDAYRGGTRGNGGTDGGTRGTQTGNQQRPPRTYQNYGNYPQHGQNAGQYTTYDPQHQYIQYPYYPHQQHLENPYYQYYYMQQQQQQHLENPEHAGEATTQPTGYNFYSGHQQQGWGNQVPAHPAQQQNTQQ